MSTRALTSNVKIITPTSAILIDDACQGSHRNTSTPEQSGALSNDAIVGIVVGVLVGLLLVIGLVVYFMKYHGRENVPTTENEMN